MPIAMTPSESFGRRLSVIDDEIDDLLDLVGNRFLLADESGHERNQDVRETLLTRDAGEGGQRPAVEVRLRVGERDQSFVLRAVVPTERARSLRRRQQRRHHVQDGFQIARPGRHAERLRLRLPRRLHHRPTS